MDLQEQWEIARAAADVARDALSAAEMAATAAGIDYINALQRMEDISAAIDWQELTNAQ